MYVFITVLTVLGLVSQRSQVHGDFINPLNYIRYERAVTEPSECLILVGGNKCHNAYEIRFYNYFSFKIDVNITIEVTPQLLSEAGQWVNVTWYNPNPQDTDWIGAYLAFGSDTIDLTKHVPFKFQVCGTSNCS